MSKPSGENLDHLLNNYVGGGGKWQWKNFVLVMTIDLISGFSLFMHLFTAYTPVHRCAVSVCEQQQDLQWLDLALPREQTFDNCHSFEVVNPLGECSEDNFNRSSIVNCDNYHFDDSIFSETISTRFSLVCDNAATGQILGTVMMLGLLLGSGIGGRIGDALGRRKSVLVSLVFTAPAVAAGGLCQNSFPLYVALRFVTTSCLPIVWINAHTLILESFSARYRARVACTMEGVVPICAITPALLAYLLRDWAMMHFALGFMSFLSFFLWIFTRESLRWLVQNDRVEDAFGLLEDMARGNGKYLSDDDLFKMREILVSVKSKAEDSRPPSIRDLFGRQYGCTTAIVITMWGISLTGNYTLSLGSTLLSGNIFVNFSLMGLTSLHAMLVMFVVLSGLGRVNAVTITFLVIGISCFAMAFVGNATWMIALSLFGKMFCAANIGIVKLVSAELYPTNLRSQAVGVCSTIGRVFALLCPYVSNLAAIWKPLPMVALGVPCIAVALMAYGMLPDSSGELPQGLDDNSKEEKTKDLP